VFFFVLLQNKQQLTYKNFFFLHAHKEKGSNHWKLPPRIQCSHYSVPEQLERKMETRWPIWS
jgi:hypothetical protein